MLGFIALGPGPALLGPYPYKHLGQNRCKQGHPGSGVLCQNTMESLQKSTPNCLKPSKPNTIKVGTHRSWVLRSLRSLTSYCLLRDKQVVPAKRTILFQNACLSKLLMLCFENACVVFCPCNQYLTSLSSLIPIFPIIAISQSPSKHS